MDSDSLGLVKRQWLSGREKRPGGRVVNWRADRNDLLHAEKRPGGRLLSNGKIIAYEKRPGGRLAAAAENYWRMPNKRPGGRPIAVDTVVKGPAATDENALP